MIEAPKPSIALVRVGAGRRTIVGASLVAAAKRTGARSCSSSARSGVVTQTRATGPSDGRATAGEPDKSSTATDAAATITRRLISRGNNPETLLSIRSDPGCGHRTPVQGLTLRSTAGFPIGRMRHPGREVVEGGADAGCSGRTTSSNWPRRTARSSASAPGCCASRCASSPSGRPPHRTAPLRYISVNVSARQFRTPGFVDQVRQALAETGVAAGVAAAGDHREPGAARRRAGLGRPRAICARWACGSRSTTSAPATRR